MRRSSWTKLGGCAAALGLLLATAPAWAVDPGQRSPFPSAEEAETLKPSDYWIGLACVSAGDSLRAQLGLTQREGLVVENVMPDGPAAKSGVEVNDVLVSAGDQLLLNVQDLVNAVDRAKENKLTLTLYRAGKVQKIDVTPTKRPGEAVTPPPSPTGPDYRDAIRRYFDQFRPGEGGSPPLRFRYFHPGTLLPRGSQAFSTPLPDDVSVTVTKQGDKPAQVEVQKGDQKWEVAVDKLDELPAEVRGPVERLLGRPGKELAEKAEGPGIDFDFIPDWPRRGAPPQAENGPKPHAEKPMEKQLEELRKRVDNLLEKQEDARKQLEEQFQQRFDELRKRLEDLRENRPRLRDSAKEKSQQGV